MEILEQTYDWAMPLARRSATRRIILHHAAAVNRNVATTTMHITHSGMKSDTASRQTTNSSAYTTVRQPP